MASSFRFWMKGMAPLAPTILPSLSIPSVRNAPTAWPVMCPLTSIPVTIRYLMLGLETRLATIFSIPIFSVLHGPTRPAPAARSSEPLRCDPQVQMATGLSGFPTSYSPVISGHGSDGFFFSAISNASWRYCCPYNCYSFRSCEQRADQDHKRHYQADDQATPDVGVEAA